MPQISKLENVLQHGKGHCEMEAIKVFVRVRPIDNQSTNSITISSNNKLLSINSNRQIQCQYDHVFGPKATQEEVYSRVKACINSALQGYNCTIMAYGQTSSGKSHSMFGSNGDIKCNPGIVPRSIRDIFKGLLVTSREATMVHISFMQVYNEQVYDLYDKSMRPLSIHEKNGSIIIPKLMQYRVCNMEQCLALIDIGLKSRAVRETSMNNASSRSHSILQIFVQQNGMKRISSKVNLVDLAGSERWLGHICDEQKSELTNINSSLHTLGRCISSLAKMSNMKVQDVARNSVHIPYRDSKLTRILQDSLGGNSKTCLLATLNPSNLYGDESISTLRFADRAHQVMTHSIVNEKLSEVTLLKREISRLQRLLYDNGIPYQQGPTLEDNAAIREDVSEEDSCLSFQKLELPNQSSKGGEEVFVKTKKRILQREAAIPFRTTSPNTTKIKEEGIKQNFEDVEVRIPIRPGHLPLSYNGACEKIVGMLGSVLVIVDTFLATAATKEDQQQSRDKRFMLSSLHTKNQQVPSNHNPKPGSKALTDSAPIRTTFHNHPSTWRDNPKGKLSSLLNQRKRLNREASNSERNNEEEIQLELANARRKRDQKVQLRDWFLEKEQRAEQTFEAMQ